jgi:hypothetical protein
MRALWALLLLASLGAASGAAMRAPEDFAGSPAALGMDWFRAFRSTFNDTVAQRFASEGACLHLQQRL